MLESLFATRNDAARWWLYPAAVPTLAALVWFGFLREAEPDVEALAGSAELYAAAGMVDQAEEVALEILEREPGHLYARLVLGLVAERRDRIDEALRIYREAIPLAENEDQVFDLELACAELTRRAGRFDAARQEIRRLEARWGERPELARLMGCLLLNEERPEDACAEFGRYLRLAPEEVDAQALYASALIENRRLSEARSLIEGLDEKDRRVWPLWQTLARSCLEAGDREGARTALSKYVQLDARALAKLEGDPFWAERVNDEELRGLLD